ncbi:5-oxoproline transporter, DUF969 family subunit, partial [Clostridioides difficile]
RGVSLFILTLPVIGVLERYGLKQRAVSLIEKLKRLTTGKVLTQNLILILGGTGCGKSTAINYLAGCVMMEVEDEDTGISYIDCL